MTSPEESKSTRKKGRWWIGVLMGDFAYSFVSEPDSLHIPLSKRRKAARGAVMRAFRHWQVWGSVLFLCAATVGFSVLDMAIGVGGYKGTLGAAIGFLLGLIALQWTIYSHGLTYYQEAVREP
jgi:hypothetical protein